MSQNPYLKHSLILPVTFAVLILLIKIYESLSGFSLAFLGILPRKIDHFYGIFLFPVLHGDWGHLFSNILPIVVMGTAINYFYRPVATKVFTIIYILHGVLVWVFARQVVHIGASGLVYGFAAFLLFSGIIRKNRRLMALSMLVLFLYGGMIWGVLPIREGVSWEGHLFGAISGIFCAWFFRKEGPQREKYSWEEEEEDQEQPHMRLWDYSRNFPPPHYPGEGHE